MPTATFTVRAMRMLGEDRVRYVLVSVAALGADTLITLNLTSAGIAPALSAAAGYLIGLALHWVLSSRFVFATELAGNRAARTRQAALFVASGFGGLVVTVAVFAIAVGIGAPAIIAKAFAVGISFCAVFLVRRHLIFPQRS
ncbi:MAG: GtrA family protein [Hyphomonadaceae bacterium]